MFLDDAEPAGDTLDASDPAVLATTGSTRNFGNNERFLLITSRPRARVHQRAHRPKGAGTESAFKLIQGRRHLRSAKAAGYLGTLKGSWKLREDPPRVPAQAVHRVVHGPGRGPGRFESATAGRCAQAGRRSGRVQERDPGRTSTSARSREQDGGTRFKGTEYVQDFSYDVWVIDQLSEGVVPLFLPDTLDNLQVVDDSFTFVAAQVAAARSQLGVSPETYPLSGPETLKSTPEWFHSPYNATNNLDTNLSVQETGDVAHNQR
jgi:hypothetical protein